MRTTAHGGRWLDALRAGGRGVLHGDGRADAEAELRAICARLGARGLDQRFDRLLAGDGVLPRASQARRTPATVG